MMHEGELLRLFRQVVVEVHGASKPVALSLEEAAREVRISVRSLRAMIRAGKVLAMKDGASLTVARVELQGIKPSMGGPENGRPRVSAKVRARLKAASLKRRNAKR